MLDQDVLIENGKKNLKRISFLFATLLIILIDVVRKAVNMTEKTFEEAKESLL